MRNAADFAGQSRLQLVNYAKRPLARRGVAAVWMQDLARHVTRVLASEEQEAWRDFVGLAGPLHRSRLAELRDLLGRLPARRIERSPDRAGRDTVHANAFFDQVE